MLKGRPLLIVLLTFLHVSPAAGQDGRGVGLRLVPGLGVGIASFGDNSPNSSTAGVLAIGGMALFPVSSSTDITLEATWRPTSIDNPNFDETFTSFYLMAGVSFGANVYFRPSLGVDLQHFGGQFAADDGTAPAIGFAVGKEKPLETGPWHLAPEGSLRFSVASGLSSFVLMFSFGIGWRG